MPEAAAKVVVWWCGVVLAAAAAEVSGAVGGLSGLSTRFLPTFG